MRKKPRCGLCDRAVHNVSDHSRHYLCLTTETLKIYRLAEVDGKKVCHFCCYFSSPKHDEVYLHMWLHHSKEDFELFGWAPWIVYNGTPKG